MKRFFLAVFAVLLGAIALSGCKNNCDNCWDKMPEYVFAYPKWEIVDKEHTDEDGNVGVLYKNARNENETMFEVNVMSKKPKAKERFTGIKKVTHSTDPTTGCAEESVSCIEGNAKECYTRVTFDNNGKVIGAEIVYKK